MMNLFQKLSVKVNSKTLKTLSVLGLAVGMAVLVGVLGFSFATAWTHSGNASISHRLGIGTENPQAGIHIRNVAPRLVVEDARNDKWVRLGSGLSGSSIVFSKSGFLTIDPRSNFVSGDPS